MMNNQSIEQLLNDTIAEFGTIEVLVQQIGGPTAPMCKYLTNYSLIRACGVIEYSFKTIVADFHNGCSTQLQNYIDKMVRGNSCNPSLDNIHKLLKSFDDTWNQSFSNSFKCHPHKNRLESSLSSLNSNRNNFAHGQNSSASFSDIKGYFLDAVEIIKMVDAAVV